MNVKPSKGVTDSALDLIRLVGRFCGGWFPSYTHSSMISRVWFSLILSPLPPSPAYEEVGLRVPVGYKAVAYLGFVIVFAVACSVINTISCRYRV